MPTNGFGIYIPDLPATPGQNYDPASCEMVGGGPHSNIPLLKKLRRVTGQDPDQSNPTPFLLVAVVTQAAALAFDGNPKLVPIAIKCSNAQFDTMPNIYSGPAYP